MNSAAHAYDRDHAADFVANVRWLIDQNAYSIGQTAGLAGMGERTLYKLLSKDSEANPELKTALNLARALRVDLADLYLPHGELVEKVGQVGLLPFVLPRPATSSRRSSAASKVSRALRSLLNSGLPPQPATP